MQTTPVTRERLRSSVIAVPPLARDADLRYAAEPNQALIRHIEAGGVDILLYGGNANFYHVSLREYGAILEQLAAAAAAGTLVIPSVGPAFGTMMDQAEVLAALEFPTVMVLPQQGLTTSAGVADGIRRFVDSFGRPVVVYLKHDGYLAPADVAALVDEGRVSWIKYAVVRDDTREDPLLRELVQVVDPALMVSGMGEQPAVVHWREFKLAGFTSGCVCVRPDLSAAMLAALEAGDWDEAERLRRVFEPLEDLRNAINPIRVLHSAVALAGLADTGPALPLLSDLEPEHVGAVRQAAQELLAL